MLRVCKYCKVSKVYKNRQSWAAHVSNCGNGLIKRKKSRELDPLNAIESRNIKCKNCGNLFELKLKVKTWNTCKKIRCHCSRACANKRIPSDATKLKISNSLKGIIRINPYINCRVCNNIINIGKNRKYCSIECKKQCPIYIEKQCKSGLASANSIKNNKRSKNEIAFYELCLSRFENVDHNKGVFDGWDADVLLNDQKVAVLWNGPWHYKKITKKHSLEQVQNRDRIKLFKIAEAGWTPYIIRDMGKHNEAFVHEQFKIFIEWMNTSTCDII